MTNSLPAAADNMAIETDEAAESRPRRLAESEPASKNRPQARGYRLPKATRPSPPAKNEDSTNIAEEAGSGGEEEQIDASAAKARQQKKFAPDQRVRALFVFRLARPMAAPPKDFIPSVKPAREAD